MSDSLDPSDFIEKAETFVLDHISEEQFGVSELAELMNMSRSNLLRKIKKETELSASQFIRKIRLKKGLELLKQTSLTVSEVSYQVGFGSTSYFIKCFREHYGHPPGEVGKRETEESTETVESQGYIKWYVLVTFLITALSAWIFWYTDFPAVEEDGKLEKSIAVLPFKNESTDSTNLYFVNGLMESTLSSLQRIEDLRVISRTSSEAYRNSTKSIPNIASELNVSYIVEGSGQRVGDQVMLNIQLIEAATDKHIWAEQYNREVVDIFSLQNEVAQKIAGAIEAIVTPEELERIAKKPTDNLEAYDYYLQALEPFVSLTKEGLNTAIPLFEKAIEHDPQFAIAYADLAISYYFLDIYQNEKHYAEEINRYADQAILYDPKSDQSLIAKALYYMYNGEVRLAIPHLEKALEYNPNSSAVIQLFSDIYARQQPNAAKYLEYALRGIQLEVAANDSVGRSYLFLHLSNAFIQNGFVDEAFKYIEMSLGLFPNNYYSPFVKPLIIYAQNQDLEVARKMLYSEWKKDTTRLDYLQEVAKFFYFQEAYDSAFYYYQKFVDVRSAQNLNLFPQENGKIALVYRKMGFDQKADQLHAAYATYCEADESIYKSASMAERYTREGKIDQAIEQLKIFAEQDDIMYWYLLFHEVDPAMKPLLQHPEYDAVYKRIEQRFWKNHERQKDNLVEKGLI